MASELCRCERVLDAASQSVKQYKVGMNANHASRFVGLLYTGFFVAIYSSLGRELRRSRIPETFGPDYSPWWKYDFSPGG
jgi:hypothetical protein